VATWRKSGESVKWDMGIVVDSMRSPEAGEGAHRVTFPDGDQLVVYPDGVSTNVVRGRAIRAAADYLAVAFDAPGLAVMVGMLTMAGARRMSWSTDLITSDGVVVAERDGRQVFVGRLPERMRPAVYVVDQGDVTVLGYLKDDAAARTLLDIGGL